MQINNSNEPLNFSSIDEPLSINQPKSKLAQLIQKRMSKIKVLARFQKHSKLDLKKQEDLIITIKILKKPRKLRTGKDIDLLESAFLIIPFFQNFCSKYGSIYYRNLLKELTYSKYTYLSDIQLAGSIPSHLFIILRGSVFMLKSEEDASHLREDSAFLTQKVYDDPEFYASDEEYVRAKHPNLKMLQIKQFFECFEQEILESNDPCSYTVICRENTLHLAMLSLESFKHQINDFQRTILQKNVDFMKSIDFFSDMRIENLADIYKNSEEKQLIMNQIIYREGDLAEEMYLIKEGLVELSQLVQIEKRKLNTTEKFIQQYFVYPLNVQTQRAKVISSNLFLSSQLIWEEIKFLDMKKFQ